jgi:hypothetical protein
MTTTLYKKIGKRYVPIKEYSPEYNDSWEEGTHITICIPGVKIHRHSVDPQLAPMIAAGMIAEEAITRIIQEELSFNPESKPVTPEQLAAWENFKQVMGEDRCRLTSQSIAKAVKAGVREMVMEADKLLDNPSLKLSHDNFILLSQLVRGK